MLRLAAPATGQAPAAGQQGTQDSIDAVARFMIESMAPKGPTVPYPEDVRPELPVAICSIERPLCVRSGDAADPSLEILGALEQAYDWLHANGWPLPTPDGGQAETIELDVYLEEAESAQAGGASAGVDGLLPQTELDGATSFARLSPRVPASRRLACAVQALAEAGLRAQDPAEAAIATEPVAAFAAFLATGMYGCADAIDAAQLSPELGVGVASREHVFIADTASASRTNALLALIVASRRHDGGSGDFIRELWQLTRQKSQQADRVRSSPNFYEALDRALQNAGESLELLAEEVAIARYFASRGGGAALPASPTVASVPVVEAPAFEELPAHLPEHAQLLGPMGSAYTRIYTGSAPAGSQLQVWLRADLGPRLSLTAVRLGAEGQEIGRMSAPARKVPQSFLPIELSPDTVAVLLVVTAIPIDLRSFAREQPYEPARLDHGFRLILDKRAP